MSTGTYGMLMFAAGLAIGIGGGLALPVIAAAEPPGTTAPPTTTPGPMTRLPSSGQVFTVLVGSGDVVMLHCQERSGKKVE